MKKYQKGFGFIMFIIVLVLVSWLVYKVSTSLWGGERAPTPEEQAALDKARNLKADLEIRYR